jgi:hypothetical protein
VVIFQMLAFGSLESAMALLRELYGAKIQDQYCLQMAALVKTLGADRLVALAAKASGRPTHTWSNMSTENSKARRLRKCAEARASAQAAKDSAAEAEVRDEQEAAAGVAAGVEEALAEYVERKRSSMSPHRLRLLKSPKMMTTQRMR